MKERGEVRGGVGLLTSSLQLVAKEVKEEEEKKIYLRPDRQECPQKNRDDSIDIFDKNKTQRMYMLDTTRKASQSSCCEYPFCFIPREKKELLVPARNAIFPCKNEHPLLLLFCLLTD